MTPMRKAPGPWAELAHIKWETNEDGDYLFTGEIVFPELPLTDTDTVELTATVASDSQGRTVITALAMNKPINSRRLKQIPFDAVRTTCAALVEQAERDTARMLFKREPSALQEAQANLRAQPRRPKTDDFYAAIAAVCLEARKANVAAVKGVMEAYPPGEISERTAFRDIKETDKRCDNAATPEEFERFWTGKLQSDDRVYFSEGAS